MRRFLLCLLCFTLIPLSHGAENNPGQVVTSRRALCFTGLVAAGAALVYLLTRDPAPRNALEEWQQKRKAAGLIPKAELDLTVLGQMHRSPLAEMGRGDELEEAMQTVLSQRRTLVELHQLIQAGKPVLVFDEGLVETLTPELRRNLGAELDKLPPPPYDARTVQRLKDRFPDSALAAMVGARQFIPRGLSTADLGRLSEEQANGLLVIGGARLWWATGQIDTLYPTATQAMMDKSHALMELLNAGQIKWDDPKMRYHFYPEREIDALLLVHRVALKNPQAVPVLIYGGSHNFPQYEEKGLLRITQKKLY